MGRIETTLQLEPAGRSRIESGETEYALVMVRNSKRLAVVSSSATQDWPGFEGETGDRDGNRWILGGLTPRNAATLRECLRHLVPRPLGLQTSAGLGDRLGLATPGHVQAVRTAGGGIAPIFAQQSIREMTRTGRTPQQVMDDATWGIFEAGWRAGQGADADHLKTPADIDACASAGFCFFTIDPGEHVDNRADFLTPAELGAAAEGLPWTELEDNLAALQARYAGKHFDLEDRQLPMTQEELLRAAVKYGRAVAHVTRMYRHLSGVMAGRGFELEVSVDETDSRTTHAEHFYIASELKRLGVRWVSLAPRYIGRFEKGVDYIGDLGAFEADFAVHASIARVLGPYKLSLHSGSDKFSIYPIAMRHTRGLVHLKTAGTSYLEALHTIAEVDPEFFRTLYAFARQRWETDKASYHVSAELHRAPEAVEVADKDLAELLDQFDARQIFHVTFGSVLTTRDADGQPLFYDQFMKLLRDHAQIYAANLERHFLKHLRPFAV